MTNERRLSFPPVGGPWVVATPEALCDKDEKEPSAVGFTALLDGKDMASLSEMLSCIAKHLRFPDYFGGNMNALYDCLGDLEWISASSYLLVVKNSNSFLEKESFQTLCGIISDLNEVGMEWSRPVEDGQEWDRPSVGFLVFFEGDSRGRISKAIESLFDENGNITGSW